MVDLTAQNQTPSQPPTLTDVQEAGVHGEIARWAVLDWLVTSEDAPDLDALVDELVGPLCRTDQAAEGS